MSENFLSRWSKRKLESLEKQGVAENPLPQQPLPVELKQAPSTEVLAELPLPTEEDLLAIKQGGDIKAFLVDKVSSEFKNKAFKALFSRPEFNVMDGLDIYIDDYNKFTPLSQEDIGKMAFSKQLLSRPDLELPEMEGASSLKSKLLDPISVPEEKPEHDLLAGADSPSADKHHSTAAIADESEQIDSESRTDAPLKMPPSESS